MAKINNRHNALVDGLARLLYQLDRLDELSSRIDHLISIVDSKTVPPPSSESPLLNTRKAAEFLGVSPKTIYNNPDRYPHIKLKDGGLRFHRAELEEFIAASHRLA